MAVHLARKSAHEQEERSSDAKQLHRQARASLEEAHSVTSMVVVGSRRSVEVSKNEIGLWLGTVTR